MASWDISTDFIGTVTTDAVLRVASFIAADTSVSVVFVTDLGAFSLIPAVADTLTLTPAVDGTLTLVPS